MTPRRNDKPTIATEADEKVRIPVIEEHLVYDAERLVTGRVDVQLGTEEQTVTVPVPTLHIRYVEQRIPADRIIDADPGIRQEGNRTIIPVIEEEIVVTKRLRLVEEIHLVKTEEREEKEQDVVLRKRTVEVRRTDAQE